MAQTWEAKGPTETRKYRWEPDLADDATISSLSYSATGITVDAYDYDEDRAVVFYVSGGVAGVTGYVTLSALTNQGEALGETIYLPIITSDADGTTAAAIVDFALRPIIGIGGTASTDEQADALEWLNDMLALWGLGGADVGASLPLTLASVVYAPREWMAAIKNNLRIYVAEQYGRQVSPATMEMARRGLQAVKMSRVPDEREEPAYY